MSMQIERRTYSITQFAAVMGWDRHRMQEEIRRQVARGESPTIEGVPVMKLGNRYRVGIPAVERRLAQLASDTQTDESQAA